MTLQQTLDTLVWREICALQRVLQAEVRGHAYTLAGTERYVARYEVFNVLVRRGLLNRIAPYVFRLSNIGLEVASQLNEQKITRERVRRMVLLPNSSDFRLVIKKEPLVA